MTQPANERSRFERHTRNVVGQSDGLTPTDDLFRPSDMVRQEVAERFTGSSASTSTHVQAHQTA